MFASGAESRSCPRAVRSSRITLARASSIAGEPGWNLAQRSVHDRWYWSNIMRDLRLAWNQFAKVSSDGGLDGV